MTKIMKQSACGFLILLCGLITFGLALRGQDILPFYLMFAGACGAVVLAFVIIFSMRCPLCGEKLAIAPFHPQATPLPNFLLWTGLEAKCWSCHKVI